MQNFHYVDILSDQFGVWQGKATDSTCVEVQWPVLAKQAELTASKREQQKCETEPLCTGEKETKWKHSVLGHNMQQQLKRMRSQPCSLRPFSSCTHPRYRRKRPPHL
ncbi:hypothetical protein KIL84_003570 [Mauremys mutica]|uniref:Uncharacterized protein n=1 Tax=Mauremys mutica TaxID=74926 RepID=A0A9D4AMS7_9SAUR|nr:hypothetical protein KIL84_003570 [Mauremys mutica]